LYTLKIAGKILHLSIYVANRIKKFIFQPVHWEQTIHYLRVQVAFARHKQIQKKHRHPVLKHSWCHWNLHPTPSPIYNISMATFQFMHVIWIYYFTNWLFKVL